MKKRKELRLNGKANREARVLNVPRGTSKVANVIARLMYGLKPGAWVRLGIGHVRHLFLVPYKEGGETYVFQHKDGPGVIAEAWHNKGIVKSSPGMQVDEIEEEFVAGQRQGKTYNQNVWLEKMMEKDGGM